VVVKIDTRPMVVPLDDPYTGLCGTFQFQVGSSMSGLAPHVILISGLLDQTLVISAGF